MRTTSRAMRPFPYMFHATFAVFVRGVAAHVNRIRKSWASSDGAELLGLAALFDSAAADLVLLLADAVRRIALAYLHGLLTTTQVERTRRAVALRSVGRNKGLY